MKKKIFVTLKKIPISIGKGILDAFLPNIHESIKQKPTDFKDEIPKLSIDYTRVFSALVSFTVIVLAIFDFITYEDILKFLHLWNVLLQ